jgi:outer membrane protein assembly factor BamD
MLRSIALLLALAAASGCAKRLDPNKYATSEALYDAAVAEYRKGNYFMAEQAFQRLTFELQGRDERQARVRYYLGECMLELRRELEAAQQFRRASDDFPRHELAPDALLRAGDAYASLWDDAELDPSYGETALATYTELLGRYPSSPAAARARERMAELNEMFAAKTLKGGVFYLRLKAFDSAIIYFRDVVVSYPNSSSAPAAVVKLIEAYDRIGYNDEKADMCLYLRQYYPNAKGAEDRCSDGA